MAANLPAFLRVWGMGSHDRVLARPGAATATQNCIGAAWFLSQLFCLLRQFLYLTSAIDALNQHKHGINEIWRVHSKPRQVRLQIDWRNALTCYSAFTRLPL